MKFLPRLIFWETTRVCNLKCPHCRASAVQERSPLDLSTEEAKRFIDSASSFCKPILVFSGGEPLLREDLYELIRYTGSKGLEPTLATNATLITEEVAKELKVSGITITAVSIYGSNAESHDNFCGESGTFNKTMEGIENIKRAGIPLQINTTITKKNLDELEDIYKFALSHNASAYHVFFLVPTGRGKAIEGDEISPQGYEDAFNRLYNIQKDSPIRIKATCAPHYHRVSKQTGKGCLAGTGVCFISHKGEVFGCGYLPISAGDLRKEDFSVIWHESKLFKTLRDDSSLSGRCGICEFKKVCGGCRARAFSQTGDYLDEEPYCIYIPKRDERILNRIQNNFPITQNPYKVLEEELNIPEEEIFNRIKDLTKKGIIRRIGANFNSNKLGYKSTLIAMKVPDERLEEVVTIINRFKGVTHNYLRDDTYNLWFTLIGDHLDRIKEETGIGDILDLPVVRQFKINAEFYMISEFEKIPISYKIKRGFSRGKRIFPLVPMVLLGSGMGRQSRYNRDAMRGKPWVSPIEHLTSEDRKLINILSRGLPISPNPYSEMGLPEEEVFSKINKYKRDGLIRRFGATLNHYKTGYNANAMSIWIVPQDKVESAGKLMAGYSEISHCYERVTYPDWPYNLYAMLHGRTKEDCERIASEISVKTGIYGYKLLYSTREFKKTSMEYF